MRNLAVYVHLPWCIQKCPYCDFNSHQLRTELPATEYLHALKINWHAKKDIWTGRKLTSIFFGGGTPSLFPAEIIANIINMICSTMDSEHEAIEVTLEANPGTFEQQRFAQYRLAGVNRLSIGVQSFDDQQLKNLGRIHNAENALDAIKKSRQAGFHNINIDLMHALPGQTQAEALQDLQTAIDLAPTHISWYQLTIEPNTMFARFTPPGLPDNDSMADMYTTGIELLHKNGFKQYEVSAFAREKKRCQHNLAYWQYDDYLGIGAGAHSKWHDGVATWRMENCKHPRQYLQIQPDTINSCCKSRLIGENDIVFEYFLNNLRLRQKICLQHFAKATGKSPCCLKDVLSKIQQLDLALVSENSIQLTDKGHLFLNDIQEMFLHTEYKKQDAAIAGKD